MYSRGYTFIDKFYNLEFKIVEVYEALKLYKCETVNPNKDSHGMRIDLICYFSYDHIHECGAEK